MGLPNDGERGTEGRARSAEMQRRCAQPPERGVSLNPLTAKEKAKANAEPYPVHPVGAFAGAARAAQARLVRARWLDLLGRSAPPVFATAVAAQAACGLAGVRACDLAGAVAVVLVWAAVCALWARARRPSPEAALALWDERAGRNEEFLSAYCFEEAAHRRASDFGDGERLHLERACAELRDERLGKLSGDLPVAVAHRAWIAPLVFVVFVASGALQRPVPAEDVRVRDDAADHAREEGQALAEETKVLDPLSGITPEEREKVEKLRSTLDATAEKLKKLSDETPREVLEQLERRAREAEKLAESLGDGEGEILSAALVAELERHADTADLAAGFRAKDLGKIAREAEKIAERLRGDISIEERKRLEDALSRALRAATARDARSLSGRSLAEAHQKLRQKRLSEAADRFSKIAKHFARARQRRQARRQLQRLADRLRSAGQRIFGPNKGGPRRLRQSRYSARPSLGRRKVLPVGSLPRGSRMGIGPLGQVRPGSGRPPGSPGYGPVPGSAPQAGAQPGMGNVPVPGGGAGQAPVPGMGAGQPGAGMGQTPVPGAPSAGAMQGGLQAGHGSAPYGSTRTKAMKAAATGTVNAQAGAHGESSVRRIDAGSHSEDAGRESRQIAMQAIQDEEDALDAEPLPLSRREQVLRYFTGLRRHIEPDSAQKRRRAP